MQTQSGFVVRRMRPDDGPALDAVFAGMSDQSRYQRFLVPTPHLLTSVRRALLDLSDRHVAFVAESAGERRPIGIGRYVVTGPDEVEIALGVVDDWHRQGVGRELLGHVVRAATEAGKHDVVAAVASDNHAMMGLARACLPGVQVAVRDRMLCLCAALPSVSCAAA
ncbi:MAG: GNAT family N-acetyltransferase [Propionibacteriales bacterium]|nr:GNAT family N-acetyltransferase [Propionibacteriales bacterium]